MRALARDAHWGHVTRDDVRDLESVLDAADDERPVQQFLQRRPQVLAGALLGGHTRVVRSQVRLGSQHVMDLAVADLSSLGVCWTLIELESPQAPLYLQSGEYAKAPRHALFQIETWRQWARENRDAARRKNGPRLIGIDEPDGLVLVGRRANRQADGDDAWLRRATWTRERCAVHTYDWLLDRMAAAVGRRF